MSYPMIEIGDLMLKRNGSVDPSKFPDETFELHSIPAFDKGTPDIVKGSEIGSSKQLVQENDVMISKIVPHIRRASVVCPKGDYRQIASGEWIVFRSDKIYPDYLKHVLISDTFNKQFMATVSGVGGSLLRARPAFVAKIKIALPPLAEQRRIASILDQADELRQKRQQAIEKLDQLLQSTFIEMFGDPVSNPKGWEKETIGNLTTFITSGSRGWAQYYADSGSKFIRIQNLVKGDLDMSDCAYVNAPDSAEAKRTLVQAGDVLVSITADLGRTAVVPNDIGMAHINQHVAILRLTGVNPAFISHYLASVGGKVQFEKLNRSAVKAGLNFNDIRSLEVLLPPQELQNKYVQIVHNIKNHQQQLIHFKKQSDILFSSLQNQAFNGTL